MNESIAKKSVRICRAAVSLKPHRGDAENAEVTQRFQSQERL